MWWFKKRPKADPKKTQDLSPHTLDEAARRQDLFQLVELFLVRRIQTELELEEKRAEVKLKSVEADAQTKLKLEEIRAQRKQLRASQAAERNRTYPRDAKGKLVSPGRAATYGCAVCADPGSPHLTVEQIRLHHQAGHSNGSVSNNS